ncbi:adenylate kinase isoenzyme 5-like [Physella acuta]|uniref:adenylate kinase isoenzyme 5-like n=1 Tax=Physella acuta TaxID=109671 RepID=UPI0027DC24F5|nr:adenylate kinase isoenzyme 5-like [Physella acuta]
MSTEDAKAYLSSREVPRLFECLMTGLMFHRPNDHIQYLIDSLEKVKTKGQAELTWNMFVEVKSAKKPLPPITPVNGKRPTSRGVVKDNKVEVKPSLSPLPPIGPNGLPDVPIIFIMGGPGSGKSVQTELLVDKHKGWVNINLGQLFKEEIKHKGAEENWRTVKELVTRGDLAPEDVTLNLLHNSLKNNTRAKGFIVQGFPRDMDQAQKFEKTISRVDAVFLLDCEEEELLKKVQDSGSEVSTNVYLKRLSTYKEKTLPVLKYYDDAGKLYIVDGGQDVDSVQEELNFIFDSLLNSLENGRVPSPPKGPRPASTRWNKKAVTPPLESSAPPLTPLPPSEPAVTINLPVITYIPPPEIKVKDEGRKDNLPQAPLIFLAGGPGSGKGTQCAKIIARYPDIVHLSMGDILRKEISERGSTDEKWAMVTTLLRDGDMAPVDVTEELLIQSMQDHPDARAFLVEGYPRDALQYEDFNRNIGGHLFTILLDCEDKYLHDRLVLRGAGGTERIDDNVAAIEKKLNFFAKHTLPLLKAIDDEKKLIVIDGDRDEDEIFYDIVKCLDYSLYGVKTNQGTTEHAPDDDDDDDREPVEDEMTAMEATFTGENGGNPHYTAELDEENGFEDYDKVVEEDVVDHGLVEEENEGDDQDNEEKTDVDNGVVNEEESGNNEKTDEDTGIENEENADVNIENNDEDQAD